MRLFFAIDAKAARTGLLHLQDELYKMDGKARLVPESNFHLTLRFIGESDRLGELALALRQAVRGIRPFVLGVDGCGSFSKGRSQVVFAKLGGDLAELRTLHESLEAALFDAGFARDGRQLKPHITLARDALLNRGQLETLSSIRVNAPIRADKVILYRSTREQGRMVYTPMHSEALL